MITTWICPICQASLSQFESQWRCVNNHSYDVAKEGYVNLLLANQKNSKDPGDNKEMVNARRLFLEQEHYASLVLGLVNIIQQHFQTSSLSLYDAGCGEGYYLQRVAEDLRRQGCSISASGSDIAKIAIRKAAKKYNANRFAVASSFNLPVKESSQHVVMQIFAPASDEEILRILTEGGLWLQVTPATKHLIELKEALYQSPQEHVTDQSVPRGFVALENRNLTFHFALKDRESREHLLMMTPFYWTVREGELPSVRDKMGELTADFNIRVLQKMHRSG